MTAAGYHDLVCPVNPEHGDVHPTKSDAGGLYCPHHEHNQAGMKPWWTWDEWETAKNQESPKDSTPNPSRTRAIPVRKPKRRKAKR